MIDADILIEEPLWESGGRDIASLTGASFGAAVAQTGFAAPATVSLLFADDDAIRMLNREHRGQDKPTNVLSFPAAETPMPGGMARPLGDIALAFQTIEREAATAGLAFEAHVQHLIIHGLLHLLGYDHENDDDATVMETTETQALARLGHSDPYGAQQVQDL